MAVYTTIDNPELYFQVKIYTGDASTQAVTLDGDEDMQPNFVWIKNRATTGYNTLFDSVRGVEKPLWSNATSSEGSDSNTLTAFGSDGFTVGSDAAVNGSGNSLVAWCWKESATAGFDIVSYTGNGSARTISHSLSAVPKMMIHKSRDDNSYSWGVYHHKLSPSDERNLNLNTTGAANVDDGGVYYNSTDPTSSVFSLGTNVGYNKSSDDYIAYLFAEKQGFSKFGSYTGNGNADGAFVYTGFRPAYILVKSSSAGITGWNILDNKRDPENVMDTILQPNNNNADANDSNKYCDFLSNGFKWKASGGETNGSGTTYIYMAFAEAPFVNSNGVPCNAR
jgi:hypothetical protein